MSIDMGLSIVHWPSPRDQMLVARSLNSPILKSAHPIGNYLSGSSCSLGEWLPWQRWRRDHQKGEQKEGKYEPSLLRRVKPSSRL